jgi:hypothetical protein
MEAHQNSVLQMRLFAGMVDDAVLVAVARLPAEAVLLHLALLELGQLVMPEDGSHYRSIALTMDPLIPAHSLRPGMTDIATKRLHQCPLLVLCSRQICFPIQAFATLGWLM